MYDSLFIYTKFFDLSIVSITRKIIGGMGAYLGVFSAWA